jgi:outer membrane protein assembly factor BamB
MCPSRMRLAAGVVAAVVTCVGVGSAAAQDAAKPGLGPPIDIHRGLSDKEWPQLQNIPQRTGYSPVMIPRPFEGKWNVRLTDLDVGNTIQRTVQPIVAEGKVFLGCKNGRFFALDAKTGKVLWTFNAGGSIRHTAGYAKGKVFFAAFDGRVYALESATGKKAWVFDNKRRHGFSTAVLLVGDKVYAVDRGGRLFCLNQSDGKEAWQYDAEAPVYQSPAWDGGSIFFADEHMQVHAVKDADGTRLWRSKKLVGLSFQQYWAVVVHGVVIVRPQCDDVIDDHHGKFAADGKDPPSQQSMFLLSAKTGEELPPVEHFMNGVHQGATPPPAVTRDGLLVARWSGEYLNDPNKKYRAMGGWLHSTPVAAHMWALQDIRDRKAPFILLQPTHVPGAKHPGIAVGIGPPDETTANSVLGDLVTSIISMGWREFNRLAGVTPYARAHGVYGLTEQRWFWEGIRPSGQGGSQFTGGVSAVSGADGLFYNVAWNTVQCHGTATPKTPKPQ